MSRPMCVIDLTGTGSTWSTLAFERRLADAVATDQDICVDVSNAEQIDSVALRAIIAADKEVRPLRSLFLRGARGEVARLLSATGLARSLETLSPVLADPPRH